MAATDTSGTRRSVLGGLKVAGCLLWRGYSSREGAASIGLAGPINNLKSVSTSPEVTGWWAAVTGWWAAVTGWWAVVTGWWAAVTGWWAVVTGWCAAVTGWWAAVTVGPPLHCPTI